MKPKGEALVARGAAHFNAGRPREALADFSAAFRLGVDRADARYFSAHARLSLWELPEALAAFAALIRAFPAHLPAYLDLASLLHREGRLLDAARTLRACLARPVVFWDWSRFAVLKRRPGPDLSYGAVEPPFSLLEARLLSRLKGADRAVTTPAGLELWKGPKRLGLLGGSPAPVLLDFTPSF
ncbi:MAG: hypothetical protein Q8T11_14735 [Elusimicrobiota bacterium]|nr:hypothetical protein [Elusimicrobiota bacterium]